MDHIVCLDEGARELENLLTGKKSMILRAHDELKIISGQISEGDRLFFLGCRREKEVRATGVVSYVYFSGKLTAEESYTTIIQNQDKLQLPDNQFEQVAGKKYLVLIGLREIKELTPFRIDTNWFNGMEDWFPLDNINITSAAVNLHQ